MTAFPFRLIGKSCKRDDGPPLAPGSAVYADDLQRPGFLCGSGGPRSLPPRARFQRSDIQAYADLLPPRGKHETEVHPLRGQGP